MPLWMENLENVPLPAGHDAVAIVYSYSGLNDDSYARWPRLGVFV